IEILNAARRRRWIGGQMIFECQLILEQIAEDLTNPARRDRDASVSFLAHERGLDREILAAWEDIAVELHTSALFASSRARLSSAIFSVDPACLSGCALAASRR